MRELDGPADYIVVGGGTAGCVMASRLSEDASVQVLLIEAGQDFGSSCEPAAITDVRVRTFFRPEWFWQGMTAEMVTETVQGCKARIDPFYQARVLGGGSTINGMHAQRGLSSDYDEWSNLVSGWGWNDVLPYFKRLETDLDFQGPDHGTSGPISLRRIPPEHWSRLSHEIGAAFARRGVPRSEDLNTDSQDSHGAIPLNIDSSGRLSTATAYLPEAVRNRPNLRILSETEVCKLIVQSGRVIGVETREARRIEGREIILCAGGVQSPAILLRSGIGPAEDLRASAICVVADRPGVGQNLQNHPMINLSVALRRNGRRSGRSLPSCAMVVRYSSRLQQCAHTDMILNVWERALGPNRWHPLGSWLANLQLLVNKPYSRGEVRLTPDKPAGPLLVRFNSFSDPRDLDRLLDGIRLIGDILAEDPLRALTNDVFWVKPTKLQALLMRESALAKFLSIAGAAVMAGPAQVRRALIRQLAIPVVDKIHDANTLRQLVMNCATAAAHVVGTCRLGRRDDPNAVVDSQCRVIGVSGLRVADASVFPTLMRAGTNLPTIMAAEKVADCIRQDRRAGTG